VAQLRLGHPAFAEALPDEAAEVFVDGVAWAVLLVQTGFEVFAWCALDM
jgi:hypothetical protein